jgi:hypothetical protein
VAGIKVAGADTRLTADGQVFKKVVVILPAG